MNNSINNNGISKVRSANNQGLAEGVGKINALIKRSNINETQKNQTAKKIENRLVFSLARWFRNTLKTLGMTWLEKLFFPVTKDLKQKFQQESQEKNPESQEKNPDSPNKIKLSEPVEIKMSAVEKPIYLQESYMVIQPKEEVIPAELIPSKEAIKQEKEKLQKLAKKFLAMQFSSSFLFKKALNELNIPKNIKRAMISWQKVSGAEIKNLPEIKESVSAFIGKADLSYKDMCVLNKFLKTEIQQQKETNKKMTRLRKNTKHIKKQINLLDKKRKEKIFNQKDLSYSKFSTLENALEEMLKNERINTEEVKNMTSANLETNKYGKKINSQFAKAVTELLNSNPREKSDFAEKINKFSTLDESQKKHLIFIAALDRNMSDKELIKFNKNNKVFFQLPISEKEKLLPLIQNELKLIKLYSGTKKIKANIEKLQEQKMNKVQAKKIRRNEADQTNSVDGEMSTDEKLFKLLSE